MCVLRSENLKTGLIGTDATFKKLSRVHQDVEMNLRYVSEWGGLSFFSLEKV